MRTRILFLILIFFVAAASAQPGPAASPVVTLRVMAYNIHHANPPSKPGVIDIDAIVGVIRGQQPDLVALQEVDVRTGRSGKTDQAAEIAGKLGMHVFFGKAIDHDGGDYGVAILSKYPISDAVVHRLPTDPATKGEPRVLTTARVTLPGGKDIRFASTHLDAQSDPLNRRLQVAEVNRLAALEKLPFIIAGDLNAAPGSDVIAEFDKQFIRTCEPCAATIPVINPQKAIDFIGVSKSSGLRATSHKVIPEQYASDHLPILAEINL